MPARWPAKEFKNKSDDEVLKTILVEKMSTLSPRSPLYRRLQGIANVVETKITDEKEIETTATVIPRVIIRIEGGNFQGASGNMFVNLSILDIDNMDACDPVRNKWELDYYRKLEREVEKLFPIH